MFSRLDLAQAPPVSLEVWVASRLFWLQALLLCVYNMRGQLTRGTLVNSLKISHIGYFK